MATHPSILAREFHGQRSLEGYSHEVSKGRTWVTKTHMSTELVMASNHLILCCPLPFLPSIFPSIRVFRRCQVDVEGKIPGVSHATSPQTNQKKDTHPTAFTSNFAYKNFSPQKNKKCLGKIRESSELLNMSHSFLLGPTINLSLLHTLTFCFIWFHCALGPWNQFNNNFTIEISLCMLSLLTSILGEIN